MLCPLFGGYHSLIYFCVKNNSVGYTHAGVLGCTTHMQCNAEYSTIQLVSISLHSTSINACMLKHCGAINRALVLGCMYEDRHMQLHIDLQSVGLRFQTRKTRYLMNYSYELWTHWNHVPEPYMKVCGWVLAVHVHWLPSYNAVSKLWISCRLVPTIIFQHHIHSHHTGR